MVPAIAEYVSFSTEQLSTKSTSPGLRLCALSKLAERISGVEGKVKGKCKEEGDLLTRPRGYTAKDAKRLQAVEATHNCSTSD